MGKQILNFESFTDKSQTTIGNQFFVGCVSDRLESKKLWKIRASGDGAIIKFEMEEPTYEFHKVVYCNHPVDSEYIEQRESELCWRLFKENYEDVRDDLESFLKELSLLAIMSAFRKDYKWRWEHEWRVLVPKTFAKHKYIKRIPSSPAYFPPHIGKVISVMSRLPKDKRLEVEGFCKENSIPFKHSRCGKHYDQ